jgi:hypothetical protein
LLTGLTIATVGLTVLVFPVLASGPFAAVDPVVQDIWLSHVAELRPIWDYGSAAWPLMVGVPVLIGLATGALAIRRRQPHAVTLMAWLVVYSILTMFQVRWGLMANILVLPFLLAAVAPVYSRLERNASAVVLRPLLLTAVILAAPTLVILAGPSTLVTSQDCTIDSAVALVGPLPKTTVLASQDPGPEMMYRTTHNVIATPYHRNGDGILFVRDVMSLSPDAARPALAGRDVGLILVCPGRDDLTLPPEPAGTLYEALVTGPRPDWVVDVPTSVDTDYVLFEVTN